MVFNAPVNRALIAALVAAAVAIGLLAVVRPSREDLGAAAGTAATAGDAAPPPTAPVSTATAPAASGTAPPERAAPEARVTLSPAQGTPQSVGDALRAARAGADAATRQAGVWQAWKEYLVLTRREGSEPLCRRVLDELIAAHRAEDDADGRCAILRAVHPTGTDEVFTLLADTARAGRTEADRVQAIELLGRWGDAGAANALQQTHPARPSAEATRALLVRIRERAATLLGELRPGAASDAERAAIDAALKVLAR